jgi:hypothetical protein
MRKTLSSRLLTAFCLVNLIWITFSFEVHPNSYFYAVHAARSGMINLVRDTNCEVLKVKPPTCEPADWQDDSTKINRHGAMMTLSLNNLPSSEFGEYQWIQVFFSLTSDSLSGPLVDGDKSGGEERKLTHYPFYWSKEENLEHDNLSGLFFQDRPGVAIGDIIWYAEVTLVGVDAHGRLTRILSYDWGYSYLNGRITVFKPYRRCTPWPFTLQVIDGYNRNPPPQG